MPQYPRKSKRPLGAVNPSRVGSAEVVFGQFIVYVNPDEGESETEHESLERGDNVVLSLPNPRNLSRPIYHKLTLLTEAELVAVKKIIDLAFSLALPIVKERDRVAKESADRGEDLYSRNYRRVPNVLVKPRPEPAHDQGVHERSESVPESE